MNRHSVFSQVTLNHFLINFSKIPTLVKEMNRKIKSLSREIIFIIFPHNS